ncbi:MAG TPA: hypothetical protein VJ828_03800 [Lacipirellulaceae bacterium]|nr:hypothetical protein [Lacipirellulaceae bacterium]
MASPFRIFRKYMKTLMVIFGVMIMFVFVVLDPLTSYLGGSRAATEGGSRRDASDVAVTWDGGSLTNAELDQLVSQRQILNSFLRNVEYAGGMAAVQAGVEPDALQLGVTRLGGPSTREDGVERSVVRTKLFADAAREAGMQVSDDAIVAYLEELGRRRVSPDTMSAMIKEMGGGRGIPPQYVLDALREEMLAYTYLNGHFYSFRTATPEQRYDDWLRVNDRIVIEAAPVPAESFLVDVPEPKPSELAEFFEKHREREPMPDFEFFPGGGQMEFPSATPGFRIPRTIDVQFIEANYDEFLAKVESQVTEEEIVKYYEDNKDPYFIKAKTDLIDEPEAPEQPGDAPAADEANVPATGASESSTNEGEPTSETSEPSQNGEDTPPAAESSAPASDESQNSQPPANAADPDSAPSAGDQSFNPVPAGVIGLASFLQQSGDETPADDSAEDAAASPAASSDAAQAAASTDNAEQSATGDQAASAAETEADSAETSAEAKPVEYQTLDEVRDEIRRRLAISRVPEQLDALIGQIHSEINTEWTTYFSSALSAEAEERAAPPPPAALADLSPLAEKHGLKAGKTGPIAYFELRASPVGKSINEESSAPLSDLFFGSKDLDLYQPVTGKDSQTANRYVAMKTSDKPGRVPELAQVRNDVVRAWKLQKAAELAEKFATNEAKKAQEAGRPLGEFFSPGGVMGEVVRTDPFAMYTGGEIAYATRTIEPFRLSEPDGIVAAGPAFMDKVFEMKVGDVAAVMNHDRSIAYVVRLVEHAMPPEELRTAYLAEAAIWPGRQIMETDRFLRTRELVATDVLESSGLKWERTPDELLEDEEEDE